MMMYPPIGELMKRTDNRYSLVIAVAKRARELSQGAEALVKCDSNKEVTAAVYELYYDKLKMIQSEEIDEESEVIAEEVTEE